MKRVFFSTDLENPVIRFRENLSIGSRVLFGQTGGRTDRRTHMTKLIDAFCNPANAPKNLVPLYSANYTKPINTIDRKQCL